MRSHIVSCAIVIAVVTATIVACSTGDEGLGQAVPSRDASSDVGPRGPSFSATAAIGAAGGSVSAGGVTLEIPDGAVADGTTWTLSVEKGVGAISITFEPAVQFAKRARVTLDPTIWPADEPGFALREWADDAYLTGLVETISGKATYETEGFSRNTAVRCRLDGVARCSGVATATTWSEYQFHPGTMAAEGKLAVRGKACVAKVRANPRKILIDGSGPFVSVAQNPTKLGLSYVRPADENHWMTREAAAALSDARTRVRTASADKFDIWVTSAFDSSGHMHAGDLDLHSFGAALDLTLCSRTATGCTPLSGAQIGILGPALVAAGFDVVHFESAKHFHVMRVSPSVGVTAVGTAEQDCACPSGSDYLPCGPSGAPGCYESGAFCCGSPGLSVCPASDVCIPCGSENYCRNPADGEFCIDCPIGPKRLALPGTTCCGTAAQGAANRAPPTGLCAAGEACLNCGVDSVCKSPQYNFVCCGNLHACGPNAPNDYCCGPSGGCILAGPGVCGS